MTTQSSPSPASPGEGSSVADLSGGTSSGGATGPAGGRRRVPSATPWGEAFGSSLAVEANGMVLVSGCVSYVDGGVHGEGDPYLQTKTAFGLGLDALREFGLGAQDVVRTRMHLTHVRDVDAVARAHRELFHAVRPTSSVVIVSGFADSRVLVEIEMDAVKRTEAGEQA